MLSIFDQDNITEDKHILNIEDSQFSKEHQHIIRKLREAYESKQVREEMQMEDDYINELLMKDEIIAEKDKSLTESKKTIEESKKTIEDQQQRIAELERQLKEQSK